MAAETARSAPAGERDGAGAAAAQDTLPALPGTVSTCSRFSFMLLQGQSLLHHELLIMHH